MLRSREGREKGDGLRLRLKSRMLINDQGPEGPPWQLLVPHSTFPFFILSSF